MMKKFAVMFITLSLLLTAILPSAVFATSAKPTFLVTSAQGKAGENVTVYLEMQNSPTIHSFSLQIQYDAAALTLVAAQEVVAQGADSMDLLINSDVASTVTVNYFGFHSPSDAKGISGSRTLAKLTFQIKNSAQPGNTAVRIRYAADDVFAMVAPAYLEIQNVDFATQSGEITVICQHTYGKWVSTGNTQHQQTCSQCGDTQTAAHSWDDGAVTDEATCTTPGKMTYTCTDCGKTKTETIAPTGVHTFGEWTSDNDATHTHKCECGKSETLPHNWNEGVVTQSPTHTDPGEMTYTCIDCGEDKTKAIDSIPDCIYGEGVITIPATHSTPGEMTYACTICGKNKTEVIDVIPDCIWADGVITTSATHTAPGVMTYTCAICGKTQTEEIPVLPQHTFAGEWEFDENGHWQHCECGKQDEASAHTYGDWVITKEPSATAVGAKEHTCSVCGYTETVEIPMEEDTDHSTDGTSQTPSHNPIGQILLVALLSLAGIGVMIGIVVVIGKRKH